MSHSILLWGFKSQTFASEIIKKTRKNYLVKECFIQITKDKSTTTVLDCYPDEILRYDYDDLDALYHWLGKNWNKNILVIFDNISFITSSNFDNKLNQFRKLISTKNQFVIISPKIIHPSNIAFLTNKKISQIRNNVQVLINRNTKIYELLLNNVCNAHIISTPIPLSSLFEIFSMELFTKKPFFFYKLIPTLLSKFPSSFITSEKLLLNLIQVLQKITSYENQNIIVPFKYILAADTKNPHFNDKRTSSFLRRFGHFILRIGLDKFLISKKKEDLMIGFWFIYCGMLEDEKNFEQKSLINTKNKKMKEGLFELKLS